MRTMAWALGAAMVLATIWGAHPAIAEWTSFDDCLSAGDGSTAATRRCSKEEEAVKDRELNGLYKQAMARRDAPGREQLQTQERAWLGSLKKCDELLDPKEGDSGLFDYDRCRLHLYFTRIAELKTSAGGDH